MATDEPAGLPADTPSVAAVPPQTPEQLRETVALLVADLETRLARKKQNKITYNQKADSEIATLERELTSLRKMQPVVPSSRFRRGSKRAAASTSEPTPEPAEASNEESEDVLPGLQTPPVRPKKRSTSEGNWFESIKLWWTSVTSNGRVL